MRRRDFVALLGSAAIWPHAARAQQPKMPVIGYLGAESPDRFASRLRAFREGRATAGFSVNVPLTLLGRADEVIE